MAVTANASKLFGTVGRLRRILGGGLRRMRWPVACALYMLCLVHSIAARKCLPNTALKFQDQHHGDSKQVTLSGDELTITPYEHTDRLFMISILLLFHSACGRHTSSYHSLCSLLRVVGFHFSLPQQMRVSKFCFKQ